MKLQENNFFLLLLLFLFLSNQIAGKTYYLLPITSDLSVSREKKAVNFEIMVGKFSKMKYNSFHFIKDQNHNGERAIISPTPMPLYFESCTNTDEIIPTQLDITGAQLNETIFEQKFAMGSEL